MPRTLICCALMLAVTSATAQTSPDAARKLAQDAVIVDTHIDAPGMLMDGWKDLGVDAKGREFDYPKARAGGLDVAFMSIYTSPKQDADGSAWQVANEMIDSVEALVQRHPDKFALLRSPQQVDALRKGDRVLLPLGMENGAPIGDDLKNLQFFFDRGVRYITLAHSAANRIADSSYAIERKWHGLSPFGKQVVAEMNRLGIMVDVSHISDESAREAIALSKVPVIASHSAFRHFTPDFERNISDELAKAVADKGGVVQVPFGTAFVDPQGRRRHPGAFPRDQRFQPAQCRAEGGRQAAGKQGGIRQGLGRCASGAGDEDRRGARPGRLRGEADRHRPCRHRLGLRWRRWRTAGWLAHDRRLSEPGRGIAGARLQRCRHPQDPGRQPAADMGGDRGRIRRPLKQ